jgi:phage terminase small subunit
MNEMTAKEYKEMMSVNSPESLVEEVSGSIEEVPVEETIEEEVEIEETTQAIEEEAHAVMDEFEAKMGQAPVISEEVGQLDKIGSVDTLKKMAYYVVFGSKEHASTSIGDAIKNVQIARFENKAHLKKAMELLDQHNFKLIDLLKARPISFEVNIKKISEIKIGD